MAVTTNLTTLSDADTYAGSYSELAAPHSSGGSPSDDTENFIQDAQSVSQSTGQATGTGAGFQYIHNTTFTLGNTNDVILAWTYYAAPTNLQTWANGGVRIGIGTGNNFYLYNAMGSNFGNYPYGGWQNTAIDPDLTQDGSVGSPSGTTFQAICFLPNVLAKITKGSPSAMDAIRYGRGDIVVTGTETLTSMATANDAVTARWGLFQSKGGALYQWKGLMSLGTASTSLSMTDSNKVVLIEDTPRVSAGFNKIEVRNASSSVSWGAVSFSGVATSITGSAPTSPGDFEVVDNATIDFDGCTFTDMGTFVFNGGTNANDVISCTFRRTKQITQGGATFSGCLITNNEDAISLVVDDISLITGNTFVSDGSNHAVDLGTISSTQTITWDNTATGYDSGSTGSPISPTSTGNEVITVNVPSGVTLTINVGSGATTPSVRNTAGTPGTINVVAGQVTLTLTGLVANTEVRIYSAGTTTELDGVENSGTTFAYTYTYVASTFIDIVIHNVDYEYIKLTNIELGSGNASLPIQQTSDRWYSNP